MVTGEPGDLTVNLRARSGYRRDQRFIRVLFIEL